MSVQKMPEAPEKAIQQIIEQAEHADVSHILNNLNDAQRGAVTGPPEHMLVLTGAGSG